MVFQLAIDPISWDSFIAIGLFALAGLISFSIFWYRSHTPRRTFQLDFQQHPLSVPIALSNGPQRTATVGAEPDGLAELHAHITAIRAATIGKLKFSLIERRRAHYSLWRPLTFRIWKSVRPSQGVFITNLWDADWEATHKQTVHRIITPQPVASPYDYGYLMEFHNPKTLIVGECLWIRVIVDVRNDWDGHLEFEAPAADGKWANARRRISLRK